MTDDTIDMSPGADTMNDDETMDRLRVLFWIALLGWMIAMVLRFTLDSTGGTG